MVRDRCGCGGALTAIVALWLTRPGSRASWRTAGARDRRHDGRGETSPPVVAAGQLLINALPWGEVTSVKNGDGAEQLTSAVTTPVVLSLPAGEYGAARESN
jgi:hypothetical protein